MKVVDRGVVFAGEPGGPRSCSQHPTIAVLPGGRWVCCVRVGPDKAGTRGKHGIVTWSDDRGKTWSPPQDPWDAAEFRGRAGRLWGAGVAPMGGKDLSALLYWVDHTDPDKPFFNERTQGVLDCQMMLSWSHDAGQTWTRPIELHTPLSQPVPPTGPMLRLSTGALAVPFEPNKPWDDTGRNTLACAMMFSNDHGKTWGRYALTANDPVIFYGDQAASVLRNDRMYVLFWTFDNRSQRFVNMHARESLDLGHTWSSIWDVGAPGQPAPAVELPDGRVVVVFVDRAGDVAIRGRVSTDGGKSYPAPSELTIYDAKLAQSTIKSHWGDVLSEIKGYSVGKPHTALLPGGDVLVVYYAGPKPDVTRIEWARLRA